MKKYDCQDADLRPATEKIAAWRVLVMRSGEHLRREGFVSTLRRISAFARRRVLRSLRIQTNTLPPTCPDNVVLDLQKGEWVEVRSAEEIRQTLDGSGRSRGLGFMPGMLSYCGKRLRVYKRAETIVLEGTGETRRLKNTVLLDGAICDGEGFACDRSCFYFWRETWLKRAVPDGSVL